MQCDEYYNRYMELLNILYQCFVDWYTLKAIGEYNNILDAGKQKLPKCCENVMRHYAILMKEHLGLNLCKLTKNKGGNTVASLKTFLDSNGKPQKSKLSKKTRHILEKELSNLRNKFLAHNDLEKTGVSINVPSLYDVLSDIQQVLNSMCYPDLDDRVYPLKDSHLRSIDTEASMGVRNLIQNSLIPTIRSTEG